MNCQRILEFVSPFEMAEKVYNLHDNQKIESGIFEIGLYQVFLLLNCEKYGYKCNNADNLLANAVSEKDSITYLNNYYKNFKCNFGLLEQTMMLLTYTNCVPLAANMFKENNFNIIRRENSYIDNYELQKTFWI